MNTVATRGKDAGNRVEVPKKKKEGRGNKGAIAVKVEIGKHREEMPWGNMVLRRELQRLKILQYNAGVPYTYCTREKKKTR